MNTIWTAITILSIISLICGGLLGYASHTFMVKDDLLIDQLDTVLPQSQCGQCGYPGCRPYAHAISKHNEMINKCVPGGEPTMLKIAEILNIEPQSLRDTSMRTPKHKIAWIREEHCIGCMKCVHVCPVDAIVGAKRTMHTVVSDICTGCDLCVSSCPTHCIEMHITSTTTVIPHGNFNYIPIERVIMVPPDVKNI
ncbi:Electron transport complex subunit RsxB [Candidatus Erwinia haradaeae]|uniref:Ion-translocating oxidoreductase complex subunit B n=1 Tax=Candidatus Erwinia haradaeae TaxID=1922217 RepID=A0A451DBY2_9GAMM|nr:electron transport complex subunit RsxB [Candidatus Erwinia haradaeae]VFP83923.1 Electron transport complex subunit RsxB [Candidatus Erwinia haradaeae]